MPRPKEFSCYYFAMYRSTSRMSCPHCNTSMLPKHFENHCLTHHNIDNKTRCVWCQSASWPAGEKFMNGEHLSSCFKKFMKSRKDAPPVVDIFNDAALDPVDNTVDYTSSADPIITVHHTFPEKHFFGIRMPPPDPMVQSLEEFLNAPIQPLQQEELPRPPVPFADENLNLAASYVLLHLRGSHDFFHAMIKIPTMESFRQAMDQDRGRSRTLHYSCWCNGGPYTEPHYRQHRHMIVVSPKNNNFRENVWSKVKLPPDARPPKTNYQCKALQKITTPLYLVNAIGYVSHRRSRCNFSFAKKKRKGPFQKHHFYLYKTLPADFKLHLALLWDNGVLELLYQTKFQNVSAKRLAQGILTHDGGQWTQKIKDFYGHEKGLAIQVARDYVPSDRVTPHFLRLAEGRKLYFEKLPEKLEEELWLQKQVEGGNSFYDAVEECTWAPRLRDQKILNFHKPVVDRCRELESRLEEERAGKEELRLKIQQLTEQNIQYKDREIARLVDENNRLKQALSQFLSI